MNETKIAFFIAYKSIIRGHRSTMILMIFILFLSFFNMLFISGVLSGITYSQISALKNYFSSDIIIGPQQSPAQKQFILNQNQIRAEIQSIPGVISTTRRYLLAGSLVFDKDKSGQYKNVSGAIMGIDPLVDEKVFQLKKLIREGEYLNEYDTDQILLSNALAGGYGTLAPNDLGGVKVGDKIKITFSNGVMRTYTVKGMYDDTIGIFETFITVREAESVLSVYNNASQILVKTDEKPGTIDNVQAKIKNLTPNLKIQNYNDLLASFASFLGALDLISAVVSIISVFVAMITIFVLIYVSAINKRRQIGLLKAIGINQSIIIRAYVFQSLFYTACGIVAGNFMIFAVLKPLLEKYPVALIKDVMNLVLVYSPTVIVSGIIGFLVAGYLAGRIPAWYVAKQDILTSIQN